MFDVVVPAAYAEATLGRAIESVLASSLLERLVVVVDAGEATLGVAREWEARDSRVLVVVSDGVGPGAARNVGLARVSAPWVAFLDADDEYEPGYLEALAGLIEQDPTVPMVHTQVVRMVPAGQGWERVDNHPLRFRFEYGDRVASLVKEPHMVGLSVAAAAFRRELVEAQGLRFREDLPWSEDADFIVRFLLALPADEQRAGFCAGAVYRYFVGDAASVTASAWADPAKYVGPLRELYVPWLGLAGGVVPRWLQNVLLYELFWYVDADRQVFHASRQVDPVVLRECVAWVKRVVGALDFEAVLSYALTPVSLDRRMLLAAWAKGAPSAPLNGQVVAYSGRRWQVARKFTYFFVGDVPVEDLRVAGVPCVPLSARWVSHTLFGVEMVRERIFWVVGQDVRVSLDGVPVRVAPFGGFPKIPVPEDFVISKVSAPARPGLVARARRALWRLRRRKVQVAQPVVSSAQASEEAVETWFYMDRVHRAGDNAEALYRFAVGAVPQVRHVFALSSESPDWQRLQDEGFNLLDTQDSQALSRVLASARELLVSDISDRVLSPLLGGLGAEQRLVFLQHGVTRKQMWRWFNSRRIDVLVTSFDEETAGLLADGSSYTLSAPEIWQTGMPRLDSLVESRQAEIRRDRVLLAPTWDPLLREGMVAAELEAWVESWTAWLPRRELESAGVEPVFFVHPNMEAALAQHGVQLPLATVTGSQLPAELVRSVAVVTDRSSLVDEGYVLGIPGLLLAPQGPDVLGVRAGYGLPGYRLVEGRENLAPALVDLLDAAGQAGASASPVRLEAGCCARLVERLLASG